MANTMTATRGDVAPDRTVRRRRGLPGTRAVVGALLVVLAALGTFATYLEATAPPTDEWLVASRHIARGQVVQEADLAIVRVDLAPGQAGSVIGGARWGEVVGTTAAVPIDQGAFILGASLQRAEQFAGELFSFAIPSERALSGQLVEGMSVDMVATYGGGPAAETAYVVRGVEVTHATGATGTFGGGQVLVTLLLSGTSAVQRVAHALGGAEVWLVRSGSGTDIPPPFSYRTGGGAVAQ